ncbi:MAG: bactofilin family protein [Polyangiales bacterium]
MASPSSSKNITSSVIAESAQIVGRVTGDGDLDVRGRIEGEVAITGDLVLGEGATIRGSVSGTRVTIRGAVLGDISATEAIVLEASARVLGNLRAARIGIALGAQIRGELDMGEVPAIAGARPAARPAAAPQVRRQPIAPARPVVVTRKAPAPVPVAIAAPPPSEPASRKAPPEPVVPAIKKGAKAVAKKKA